MNSKFDKKKCVTIGIEQQVGFVIFDQIQIKILIKKNGHGPMESALCRSSSAESNRIEEKWENCILQHTSRRVTLSVHIAYLWVWKRIKCA